MPTRIAIAGFKAHASVVFEALQKSTQFEIVCVFTDEDSDKFCLQGRQQLSELARSARLPVYASAQLSEDGLREIIAKLSLDLVLLVEWRAILKKQTFNLPRLGVFCIHDSLLPSYRGSSPLNWAIINGERTTGASLIRIDTGADTGPIYSQNAVEIGMHEYVGDVLEKLFCTYASVALDGLEKVVSGVKPVIQNTAHASYCAKRVPSDGLIDFNQDVVRVYNFVRALASPYPGAFAYYDDQKIIISRARPVSKEYHYVGNIPGALLKNQSDSSVWVLCGSGILSIDEIIVGDRRCDRPRDYFKDPSVRLMSRPKSC